MSQKIILCGAEFVVSSSTYIFPVFGFIPPLMILPAILSSSV
jgi:hypothetical protein